MKKAYMKPEIIFEDFSLSQNIATGCEEKIDTQSNNQCGIEWTDGTLFLSTMTDVCNSKFNPMDNGGGDGEWQGICYHVFSNKGERNLFNS